MPTFSIITITYNAEKYLERTIRSIIGQTSQDFEYLIIDGGSKDSTLAIAEKYREHIDVLISENDKGLYDAMNKGLAMANGEFVWFMNAGDEIASPTVVEELLALKKPDTDVFYGDSYFVAEDGKKLGLRSELTPHRLPADLQWRQMKYGMLVCHQAFIARRSIAPVYDITNLSADVDWEISVLKKARGIVKSPNPIALYLVGGISNQQLKKSLTDRYKVIQKHFGLLGAIQAHVFIAGRGALKMLKSGGKYW